MNRWLQCDAKQAILVCALFFFCSGCATSGYFADRGRDAADIFTFTVGKGAGLSGRAGPVHCGFYLGKDRVGLRSGEFKADWNNQPDPVWAGLFDPFLLLPGGEGVSFGEDIYIGKKPSTDGGEDISLLRGKRYYSPGVCPFIFLPQTGQEMPGKSNPYLGRLDDSSYPYHFLTQVELAVGLGLTIRVGVNPGEMLDFLLGWVGLDLYSDDLSRRRTE